MATSVKVKRCAGRAESTKGQESAIISPRVWHPKPLHFSLGALHIPPPPSRYTDCALHRMPSSTCISSADRVPLPPPHGRHAYDYNQGNPFQYRAGHKTGGERGASKMTKVRCTFPPPHSLWAMRVQGTTALSGQSGQGPSSAVMQPHCTRNAQPQRAQSYSRLSHDD